MHVRVAVEQPRAHANGWLAVCTATHLTIFHYPLQLGNHCRADEALDKTDEHNSPQGETVREQPKRKQYCRRACR